VQVIVAADGGAPRPRHGAHRREHAGNHADVPLGAAASSARVVTKISAGGETARDTAEISRGATGLVGDAVMYRGTAGGHVAAPAGRGSDVPAHGTCACRVGLTGELDQRSARLLSRTGQPLAIPVAVTERETDGRKVVAADLNLAPLSAGDYVIELTVGTRDKRRPYGWSRSKWCRDDRSEGSRVQVRVRGSSAFVLLSGVVASSAQQTPPQQRRPSSAVSPYSSPSMSIRSATARSSRA
jgi:hypothetical protein